MKLTFNLFLAGDESDRSVRHHVPSLVLVPPSPSTLCRGKQVVLNALPMGPTDWLQAPTDWTDSADDALLFMSSPCVRHFLLAAVARLRYRSQINANTHTHRQAWTDNRHRYTSVNGRKGAQPTNRNLCSRRGEFSWG